MLTEVVGMEEVKYTKKDGTPVHGHSLHVLRDKMGVLGRATENIWISMENWSRLPQKPEVGEFWNFEYDSNRRLEALTQVKKP